MATARAARCAGHARSFASRATGSTPALDIPFSISRLRRIIRCWSIRRKIPRPSTEASNARPRSTAGWRTADTIWSFPIWNSATTACTALRARRAAGICASKTAGLPKSAAPSGIKTRRSASATPLSAGMWRKTSRSSTACSTISTIPPSRIRAARTASPRTIS